MSERRHSIGIDLGNTNSSAAVHDGVECKMISNPRGDNVTPSVIAQIAGGDNLIGQSAITQSRSNEHTFQRWKRYLGADFYPDEYSELPLVSGDKGKAWISGLDGVAFPPERLSSEMITFFLDAGEMRTGTRPNGAVITIPASYPQEAKLAVQRAAEVAGLKRVSLLPEPVAAAVAYGIDKAKMESVMVIDVGGSTSDASIMRVGAKDGKLLHKTLSTLSDNRLGGMDFDKAIAQRALDVFEEKHGVDLRAVKRSVARVNDACELAKIELSLAETAAIEVTTVFHNDSGVLALEHQITRAEFEELVKDKIDRIIDLCREAVQKANENEPKGFRLEELDKVILVGGQTMMPAIEDAVEKYFGRKPLATVNPFEVVARGASIVAAQQDGRLPSFTLNDRTSMSVGITSNTHAFMPIIKRGSAYPAEQTITLETATDDQKAIALEIRQGNHVDAQENDLLEAHFFPVEPGPAGQARIDVLLSVDPNGIVAVERRT